MKRFFLLLMIPVSVLLLVACAVPGRPLCAPSYAALSTEEAIEQASTIVIGTVETVVVRAQQTNPGYEATVRVEQALRGKAAPGEPVTVFMICEAFMQPGEHVLLLLEEWAMGTPPANLVTTTGGPQGKYQLTAEGQALNGLGAAYSGRNTTLAQLLTLIEQLHPPVPAEQPSTAAATTMPGAVQPTKTPAPPQATPVLTSSITTTANSFDWVAPSVGQQRNPKLAGDIVIWVQEDPDASPGASGQIWARSLTSGQVFAVAPAPGRQEQPAISGDIIVWEDSRNSCPTCDLDIYGYRLSTGQEFAIATGPTDQMRPLISGSTVFWFEEGAIHGRHLDAGHVLDFVPPPVPGSYGTSALDGDIFVYAEVIPDPVDRRVVSSTLYAYNVETGVRALVADNEKINYPRITSLAISGNQIAWTGRAVHVFDLASGQERVLPSAAYPSEVNIDGHWVVWSELSPSTDRFRLAGYNLAQDAYWVLYDSGDGNQSSPSIEGAIVVWMSERNGVANLALYNLSENDSSRQPMTPMLGSVDTTDWLLYTSTQYGFSMQYPPGWQYQEVPNAACPMAGNGVWFFPGTEQWCPGYTDARADVVIAITDIDPSPSWQPQYFDDYQVEQFKLGEIAAVKIAGVNKESHAQEVAVIANVGRYYLLALPGDSSASLQYFEAILSTFVLVPATP